MNNPDEKDCHTISMASSKLSWSDVDQKVKNGTFRNRSQYIQYLVERDINKKRFEKYNKIINTLIMLLGFCTIILLIIIGR